MTSDAQKTALVTGGSGGIGLATARAFHEAGYRVVLADIDPSVTDVAAKEFAGLDGAVTALGVVMDVSDEGSVDHAMTEAEASMGRIDILVNNASVFAEVPFQTWQEVELDTWDRIMAVNLRGPFICARRALPAMIENGWGRIVNIGSTSSISGMPLRLPYTASKGGVVALTRSLARAVGESNVTVNCVAPGSTRSAAVLKHYPAEMLGKLGTGRAISRPELPEDLTGAVLFLASEGARFVTGQTLAVDGGAVFV